MSVGKVLGLGLIGAAVGGTLTAFGITPDLLKDPVKDAITSLAGSNPDVLKDTGIQLLDAKGVEALGDAASNLHLFEHNDKVITIAKEGLTAINTNGLTGSALEAAQAVNAHFVEPSALAKTLTEFATVTPENAQAATDAIGKVLGPESAKEVVKTALENGGKLTEGALSTIGSTPFEQSQFLSNVVPVAGGATAGLGAGLLTSGGQKPAIGPHTQKVLAQRQQQLASALQNNGVQMG